MAALKKAKDEESVVRLMVFRLQRSGLLLCNRLARPVNSNTDLNHAAKKKRRTREEEREGEEAEEGEEDGNYVLGPPHSPHCQRPAEDRPPFVWPVADLASPSQGGANLHGLGWR